MVPFLPMVIIFVLIMVPRPWRRSLMGSPDAGPSLVLLLMFAPMLALAPGLALRAFFVRGPVHFSVPVADFRSDAGLRPASS